MYRSDFVKNMSTANFLAVAEHASTDIARSHHSVAMEEYADTEMTEDVGVSEKPLSRFEKSLFALVSG